MFGCKRWRDELGPALFDFSRCLGASGSTVSPASCWASEIKDSRLVSSSRHVADSSCRRLSFLADFGETSRQSLGLLVLDRSESLPFGSGFGECFDDVVFGKLFYFLAKGCSLSDVLFECFLQFQFFGSLLSTNAFRSRTALQDCSNCIWSFSSAAVSLESSSHWD